MLIKMMSKTSEIDLKLFIIKNTSRREANIISNKHYVLYVILIRSEQHNEQAEESPNAPLKHEKQFLEGDPLHLTYRTNRKRKALH